MSILLDAVTRSKQQENGFDPVSSPRPQYRPDKAPIRPGKLLLLPAALSLAVAAAWGVNQWWLQPAPQSSMHLPVQAGAASAANVVSNPAQTIVPNKTSLVQMPVTQSPSEPVISTNSDTGNGVRLAGKAALPAPVNLNTDYGVVNPPPVAVGDPNSDLSFEVAEETAEARAARLEALMAAGVTDDQRRAFDEVMQTEESRPRQVLTQSQSARAPSTQGMAALQAEVDKAAAEFGLQRTEPKPVSRSDSNTLSGDALVQAFEAALKEVEFTESANRDVTPAPVSTIPQTSDYPRYGDLPAGLQLQVPEFTIMAHVYSNDPSQRWLNVDGAELQEGDSIKGSLSIVEIRPRDVVLSIDGTAFKVPAI
ncbi:general secretion pathway protein GspB [Shewanella litorisediminis]|uniref:General secretion pathway protein GspB n=1 Tax=Shewanella litorisediminis TaxID=1173586 RepID=A0ABX7G5K7_9GAMM|nr:general secretion pathway protein GspB [Shewanella litorisediminis]MCL2917453.1 general secretion pathway protein GspB [Shewanella litorisediminis]QRH02584.1 general secretion pathway protein GspB [Shewanella litorisediminis]